MNPTTTHQRPGVLSRRMACLLAIILGGIVQSPSVAAINNVPANQNASVAAKNVLKLLAALPTRPGNLNKCISGQMAGEPKLVDPVNQVYDYETGYADLIAALADEAPVFDSSGAQIGNRWVGLIGLDFVEVGTGVIASGAPSDPTSAMGGMMSMASSYWNSGGLVTFSAHLRNPWNLGNCKNRNVRTTTLEGYVDFSELYSSAKSNTDAYKNFHSDLDKIAAALNYLKNRPNSVVVLFRPLHELNSNTFWWSYQDPNTGYSILTATNRHATEYKALWQHVFDYLTVTKGVTNVLFEWCVVRANSAQYRNMEIAANSDRYYPDTASKKYVDVVALDYYGDQLGVFPDGVSYFDRLKNLYANLKHHNRPVALGECGRTADENADPAEIWNNLKHIQNIRDIAQPTGTEIGDGFVYFMNWKGRWSIMPTAISNSINEVNLLNHGWTLNMNEPSANILHGPPNW